MTNELNQIKTIDIASILELSTHKHIVDAFVTDENHEREVVIAIVARVRLADIKNTQGWNSIVVDAKRSHSYNNVEITVIPNERIASNSVNLHLDTGKQYSSYEGYNIKKEQDYIKKNGKKTSERFQQFYMESINPED